MEPTSSTVTLTQREQWMVETKVSEIYNLFSSVPFQAQTLMLELQRDKHMEYLTNGLKHLGPSFCVLDAKEEVLGSMYELSASDYFVSTMCRLSRPWLCYWILHSIALLGDFVECELENDAVDFLNRCQDANGGYAGGPGQLPHLATTYAAVNSLITLGGEKALSSIDRDKLHGFLLRMKDPSGGFRMHDAGEMDVRACYTAISVASVLDILDNELVHNVGNYIISCQTYEGGIAGEPGSEAHGGYTFCGLATMILINEAQRLDLASLLDWVVFRQGVECGFQGRINKLVDGCYSFWQGGVCALLQRFHRVVVEQLHAHEKKLKTETTETLITAPNLLDRVNDSGTSTIDGSQKLSDVGFSFIKGHIDCDPLFQCAALQQYILLCSQVQDGGFRDKPGKQRDHYHTCYCLSGLSVSQYCWSKESNHSPPPKAVFGPYSNLLEPTHPLFNLVLDRYYDAREFFSKR